MANAADYLLLDTTQLLNTYKLRTRSIESRTFVAKNIAPNYVLSAILTSNLDGVTLSPSAFILQPNESITVSVQYETDAFETLPVGTVEGSFDITVSAVPIVVPQIPSAPPTPDLPEAPRQIVSRIQVLPTNFTLSEVGETTQFSAILYVDDVPQADATLAWSLENDTANAFSIDTNTGIVKALINGVSKATVRARLLTPTKYVGTEGLAIVAANIPTILPVGGEPVPTTGNLTITINGIGVRGTIGANVTISGINQSITKTTTFNNIPAGTYTVTPNVVTDGGVNYNPTGGGQVVVAPGQNAQIVIEYTKQSPPDANTIQIVSVADANGNTVQQGQLVTVGDRIVVVANTFRNGILANIGDVQFTANNTQEGTQVVSANANGTYKTVFTVTEAGSISISAYNQLAGSVTGQISSIAQSTYTIRVSSPETLVVGQCAPITAVVLKDGVETNIAVEIDLGRGVGRIGTEPCALPTPPTPPTPTPPAEFTPPVQTTPVPPVQTTPQPTSTTSTSGGGGGGGSVTTVTDAFGGVTVQDNSATFI
jgi:hypothetical protein